MAHVFPINKHEKRLCLGCTIPNCDIVFLSIFIKKIQVGYHFCPLSYTKLNYILCAHRPRYRGSHTQGSQPRMRQMSVS